MEALGQLQPIVITRDNRLVAGYRRILAAKQLGWEFIEAVHFERLPHESLLLRAEGEENTCHKPFLPSEAIAMGMLIEEAEREAAKKRQGTRTDLEQHSDNLSGSSKGRTREKVGAAIGLSGAIYERGRTVVQAAQEEPEKYGYLIAKMDIEGVTAAYRGVNPAFDRVKAVKKMEETVSAPANPNAWDWNEKLDMFIERETMHLSLYTTNGLFQALRDGVVVWPTERQFVLDTWQAIISAVGSARPRLEVVPKEGQT